jgi:penicillin-binding protein 1C
VRAACVPQKSAPRRALARGLRLARGLSIRRALAGFAALALLPWVALALAAALTELPPELAERRPPSTGVVLRDRSAAVLRELRGDDGARARWITLDEAGPRFPRALVAAEDLRFYRHPGVDPIAILRAALQDLAARRVVSGASTLTQQLARALFKRPRTLRGKLAEMALAIRIEWSLSKGEILEQYQNRIAFGPSLRGVEAASRAYFDKPARDLSLAEAAALASLPRGPSLYDPAKGAERLLRRRDRVLGRMRGAGLASADEVERAAREPLVKSPGAGLGLSAPHLVRAVMAGAIEPPLGPLRNRAREITLTIDRSLQREIEVLAAFAVRGLRGRHVSAAAVVVLENATCEILAYVGSPDIEDAARLGHNDGVLALRQPGSALKPFVYELAMERLGWTAATALPDVELYLPTRDGDYHPNNYDGRFHGPVRIREALADSFNVPAVFTAAALGPARVLERLRALGLLSLGEDAEHYGAAIALGDGEVRLLDLAAAYAAIARGGALLPPRAVKAAVGKDGASIPLPAAKPIPVMDPGAAYVVTSILADPEARLASFGPGSPLELPFPAAAKTGTSKGFRDNLAVGFTPEVTVAVWVGNFDGSPMEGVSGVSGAGPLFHDALIAAMRGRPAGGFAEPAGLEEATVCSLSGELPGPACEHTRREVFARVGGRRTLPERTCPMHERVRVDVATGLRAGPACSSGVEARSFERFGAELSAWARTAGRTLAPEAYAPRCPEGDAARAATGDARGRMRVAYPPDAAVFAIDPSSSAPQAIRVRVEVPPGVSPVMLAIDGQARRLASPFVFDLPLAPGLHVLRASGAGLVSDPVTFTVH